MTATCFVLTRSYSFSSVLDQIFLPYIMVELETEQQELPLQSVMVGAKNNSDIAVRGMKYFLKTQGLDIPVLLSDIPLRY